MEMCYAALENGTCKLSEYSTAQLQGNVCMLLKHMQDMSEMCAGHIWVACKMCPECVRYTSMQAQNFAIKLKQDECKCHALFC